MRRHGSLVRAMVALLLAGTALPVGLASSQTSSSPPKVVDQLTGLAWDGHDFRASYGETSGGLLNVSLDGTTVSHFAPSFTGIDEVYIAVSHGDGGFRAGDLFVSSNRTIYEISPSGSNVSVFSSPPGASRIGYLAFDTLGAWGHRLLAADDNGLLWSIGPNGTGRVITDFGKGVKPEGIAVAPPSFGRFSGYLFICLEYASKVVAVPPNDSGPIVNVTQFPGEEPERVMLVPPSSDLYVAKFASGTIFRMSASDLASYVGTLLVITEGDVKPVGSMTSLKVVDGNITTTRFYQQEDNPHFEGADFVPTSAAHGSTATQGTGASATSSTTQEGQSFNGSTVEFAAVVAVVAVVVVAIGIMVRRSSRRA